MTNTMEFRKINKNPKGIITKDCAIRAIASAFNMTWEDALMDLTMASFATCLLPNATENIKYCLEGKNWVRHAPHPKRALKDMRFRGTHIVFLYNKKRDTSHLTYVENGVLIDTWDCSDWKVKCYYTEGK